MNNRITKQQDVNDDGQQIWRPTENFSKPIKPHWLWIWIIVVALVILAWIFLYWYFTSHQAPYAAPIGWML